MKTPEFFFLCNTITLYSFSRLTVRVDSEVSASESFPSVTDTHKYTDKSWFGRNSLRSVTNLYRIGTVAVFLSSGHTLDLSACLGVGTFGEELDLWILCAGGPPEMKEQNNSNHLCRRVTYYCVVGDLSEIKSALCSYYKRNISSKKSRGNVFMLMKIPVFVIINEKG